MGSFTNTKLITDLKKAINNHELVLHYQPQFNLHTSSFDGVEALLRWQHPKKGLVQPNEFIRFAEETDLIIHIGEWVLRSACQQYILWRNKGLKPIRIAVNVAEKQFRQENFVNHIAEMIQEYDLNPHYLELEILENIIIHKDDKKMTNTIQQLKQLGVLITLDDFCTRSMKVDYLTSIPIDRIKIDKEVIKNLCAHEEAARVRAIIEMAQHLNIQVLAEGVESREQLHLLSSQHCDMVQGFYFSEPLSGEKIEQFFLSL